jgi:4-amino-4-deoxy-L-arabinose transferase-like glycosyltransferase
MSGHARLSSHGVPHEAHRASRARAERPAWHEALWLTPLMVLYVVACAVGQPGSDPVRDEPALLAAAARFLDGDLVPGGQVVDPREYLWHGPGLVAVLAPLVALDLPLTAIRFVEPVLLGFAALLFHRLLRLRLPARPALIWTYAFGIYGPFLAVVPQVHKEPLAVLLVVAGMFALTRALETGRWLFIAGAGLALAALTMVRLEYGWVAVALLAVAIVTSAVRRRIETRRLVAMAAVAVGGCVPWLAYTYHLTDEPLYWGTSAGLSLFWMSPTVAGETGQWHEPRDVFRDPALAAYRPLFRRVEASHPVAGDRLLREEAMTNIRARPAEYGRNLIANAGRLFFAAPMRPFRPLAVAAYALFNGLLLAGVGWAAVRLWRRRRSLPPEVAPIALFAAVAIALHLPPSASPRMLLPIVPPLVWLIAQAANPVAPRGSRTP